jgi:hypothetical protein
MSNQTQVCADRSGRELPLMIDKIRGNGDHSFSSTNNAR